MKSKCDMATHRDTMLRRISMHSIRYIRHPICTERNVPQSNALQKRECDYDLDVARGLCSPGDLTNCYR